MTTPIYKQDIHENAEIAELPPLPLALAQMMADGSSSTFSQWVFEDVLPAIFYTGGYVLNSSKSCPHVANLYDLPIEGKAFELAAMRHVVDQTNVAEEDVRDI